MEETKVLDNQQSSQTEESNYWICPGCQHHIPKEEKNCAECGYVLYDAKREIKKKKFVVLLICLLVLVLLVVGFVIPQIKKTNEEKYAARAIVALSEVGSFFDDQKVDAVYIVKDKKFYTSLGEKSIFVRAYVNDTNCLYCICFDEVASFERLSSGSEVYPSYRNDKYDCTIYAIGEVNYKNPYKSALDMITDKLSGELISHCEKLNKDTIMDRYYSYK